MLKLPRSPHYLSSVINYVGLGRACVRRWGTRGAIHSGTANVYAGMGGRAAYGMAGWHVTLESHDGDKRGTAYSRPLLTMTPDEAVKLARELVRAAAEAAARSDGGEIRDGRLAGEAATAAFVRTFTSATPNQRDNLP